MRDGPMEVVTIEVVKYSWPDWYVRVTEATGRVWHYGPWKTEWAADQLVGILWARYAYEGQDAGPTCGGMGRDGINCSDQGRT